MNLIFVFYFFLIFFLNSFLVSNFNKEVKEITGQFFNSLEEDISPNCHCSSKCSSKNKSSSHKFASSTETSSSESRTTYPTESTNQTGTSSDSSSSFNFSSSSSNNKRESEEDHNKSFKRQNVGCKDENKLSSIDGYEYNSSDHDHDDEKENEQNIVKEKDLMELLNEKCQKLTHKELSEIFPTIHQSKFGLNSDKKDTMRHIGLPGYFFVKIHEDLMDKRKCKYFYFNSFFFGNI